MGWGGELGGGGGIGGAERAVLIKRKTMAQKFHTKPQTHLSAVGEGAGVVVSLTASFHKRPGRGEHRGLEKDE